MDRPLDRDGERALCERYARRIFGYGLRQLRDRAAAEDLVQHVLLAVLQAVREGRQDPSRLDAYVLGACRNSVFALRRGVARREHAAEQASLVLPEFAEPAAPLLDRRRLEHCLQGLEPRDRAVVLATYVEEQDAVEIGRAMNLTAGNVRVIRHRTLARLQACVEGAAP